MFVVGIISQQSAEVVGTNVTPAWLEAHSINKGVSVSDFAVYEVTGDDVERIRCCHDWQAVWDSDAITGVDFAPHDNKVRLNFSAPETVNTGDGFAVAVRAEDKDGNLLTDFNETVAINMLDCFGKFIPKQAVFSGGLAAFNVLGNPYFDQGFWSVPVLEHLDAQYVVEQEHMARTTVVG